MRHRFGEFELDAARRELRRDGRRLAIQPLILDLLLHLVEHRDRVVPKDELLRTFWDGAVVTDAVLTTAINKARSLLGDSSARQWAIATAPRRGYRFVAEVDRVADDAPSSVTDGSPARAASAIAPLDPDFVGRTEALAHLESQLAAAASGRGGIVVVHGAAGIGKTRLARRVGALASARGFDFLSGFCDADQGAPPYWPWIQLLRAAIDTRGLEAVLAAAGTAIREIAAICPELSTTLGETSSAPALDPAQSRFRLIDGLGILIARLAADRPLLVLLDDLQWADRSSLRVLELVARGIADRPLLLIATCRSGDPDRETGLDATLASLARAEGFAEIELSGLRRGEVVQLVEHLRGRAPEPDYLESVLSATGGNPYFIHEIARAPIGSASLEPGSSGSAIPRSLRATLRQRLSPLPARCRALLDAAAIIGRDFSAALVARVAETPLEEALDLLDAARAAALVEIEDGRPRFHHALVQEVLVADLGHAKSARLHLAVAMALEADGTARDRHLREIAHHRVAALPLGGVDDAIVALRVAGERAIALHAFDEALESFERAIGLQRAERSEDEMGLCGLLLAAAAAGSAAGLVDGVARERTLEVASLARRAGWTEWLIESALELGRHVGEAAGGDETLIGLHEEALAVLGPEATPTRARLLGRLAVELHGPGSHAEANRRVEEALRVARECGDPDALGEILNHRIYCLSGPDRGAERARVAEELLALGRAHDNLRFVGFGLRWRAIRALETGDPSAFDRALRALGVLTEEERGAENRWCLCNLRVAQALARGELSLAERLLAEGRRLIERDAASIEANVAATQIAYIRREQGRLREIAAFVLRDVDAPSESPGHWPYRASVAFLHAELGDLAAARKALDTFPIDAFLTETRGLAFLFVLCSLAEASAISGARDVGERLFDALEPLAPQRIVTGLGGIHLGPAARALARLATMLRRYDEAVAHARDAVAACEGADVPLWHAHACLAEAEARLARGAEGDLAAVRDLLGRARTIARAPALPFVLERAERIGAGVNG